MLVGSSPEAAALLGRWQEAEEALSTNPEDQLTRWTAEALGSVLETVGLAVEASIVHTEHELAVTEAVVARWFSPREGSYAHRLSQWMSTDDLLGARAMVAQKLRGRTIPWTGQAVRLVGRRGGELLGGALPVHQSGDQAED